MSANLDAKALTDYGVVITDDEPPVALLNLDLFIEKAGLENNEPTKALVHNAVTTALEPEGIQVRIVRA